MTESLEFTCNKYSNNPQKAIVSIIHDNVSGEIRDKVVVYLNGEPRTAHTIFEKDFYTTHNIVDGSTFVKINNISKDKFKIENLDFDYKRDVLIISTSFGIFESHYNELQPYHGIFTDFEKVS